MKGVFITGTDTGVGKTEVACLLLRAMAASGLAAVGMKPVAAGVAPGETDNEDVTRLEKAGNVVAPKTLRCPYQFAPAIAPHLAARRAGVKLSRQVIGEAYRELAARADWVVVEGAGGALVPLGEDFDMLDVARELELPVLLVVGLRLGCLNHARLSRAAIAARGLECVGWVANVIDPAMPEQAANIEFLEGDLAAPHLATLPWRAAGAGDAGTVLNSSAIGLWQRLRAAVEKG